MAVGTTKTFENFTGIAAGVACVVADMRVYGLDQIVVFVGDTTEEAVRGADYTATVAGDGNGCTVVPLAPLPARTSNIRVARRTPLTSDFAIAPSGKVDEIRLTEQLDRNVMRLQEDVGKVDHSLRVSDAEAPLAALPGPAARSNTLLGFDTAGNPVLHAGAAGPVVSVAGRSGVVVLAKTDVGLGNCDNTTDLAKPISTATASALADKADLTALASKVDTATVGAPGGVAPLNGAGKLPAVNAPNSDAISEGAANLYHTSGRVLAALGTAPALGGAIDTANDTVVVWDTSAGQSVKVSVASLISSGTAGVATFQSRSGAVTLLKSDVEAATAGDAGALSVNLSLSESAHTTSNRASIQIGSWLLLQDRVADGTRNFGVYDISSLSFVERTDLDGTKSFKGGQSLPGAGGFKYIKCINLASGTDLDSVIEAATYDVELPVNGPYAGVAWLYLEVLRYSDLASTAFVMQRCTSFYGFKPVEWLRKRVGGLWTPWVPTSGYATPAAFGATGGSTLDAAATDDTTALTRWVDYGLLNPGVPLVLDQFYKLTAEIYRDITGLNGFGIRSLGPASRAGLSMSGTAARLTFVGADQSNPSGFDADLYHFSDFMLGVDADRTNHLISLSAAPDSGSAAPGLCMRNVHVLRNANSSGVTGDVFFLKDIRKFDVSYVTALGKYFGYQGQLFGLYADAGGAPVEGCFHNVQGTDFNKVFRFSGSNGAIANDDWQGMIINGCAGVAVNMLVHASTGPEASGFSELMRVTNCHAYYREIAVFGEKVGNVKVNNCDFLGHGDLATIQGVALTGTSIAPVVDVSHNTFRNGTATGANRYGINVPTMTGVAVFNRATGLTNAFGLINGTVTTTGNTTY